MKKSKAILMVVCAMLLVAASVMGTLAYLTSTATVTNTFSVGNVAITMDETDVDNSTADAERDIANSYKLMPGHTYTKDPIIHVATGSEDCYLFVKVVNEIAAIEEKGTDDVPATTTVAAQIANKGWTLIDANKGIYAYGVDATTSKPTKVTANADITVFEQFVIDDAVTNTTLADYSGKTIVVTAYAIQADGFESMTASQIWTTANFQ